MLPDFIAYFRNLAITHKDIQHDPASDENDAEPGSAHFGTQTYMETVTGPNIRFGSPLLLLNIYASDLEGADLYDIKDKKQSAFTVLVNAESKTHSAKNAALAKAEKITYDLLQKIWDDHYGKKASRCAAPLNNIEFDKISIDSIGPINNNMYGWVVEFRFTPWNFPRINHAPEDGIFI